MLGNVKWHRCKISQSSILNPLATDKSLRTEKQQYVRPLDLGSELSGPAELHHVETGPREMTSVATFGARTWLTMHRKQSSL